jgi:sec-independent protein translocase protein TatB
MLNLDPAKLLVIAVVAIILLGPDRLPQVARQAGAAWRSFNEFRHRMESEVRDTMPDLPSASEIARLARSPTALLNHLSSMSDSPESTNGDGQPSTNGDGTATAPADGDATAPAEWDATAPADGDATAPVEWDATVVEPPPATAAQPDLPVPPARPAPSAPPADAGAYGEPLPGTGSASRRVPQDPGVVAPGDPTLN